LILAKYKKFTDVYRQKLLIFSQGNFLR